MKLGSLFDGSGGFPLSGSLCGITPVWASEVEPYPIAVTTSRFPSMRHIGDVSKINGAEITPVDIITFGSPCQDLSVAGKRAGLKHEANGDEETTRSGLFMEAVRIIKEMRRATNGVYPRFAIWENVPGAFSSNGGEDFRVVLEELIKIVEPRASVPSPEKGKWPYADAYVGDGWSLAYRTLDAQYWGVPQRRRRIYLVLDLRAECAHKVLFECEGLRGYFETGRALWQRTAGNAENCIGAADSQGEGNCVGFMRQLSGVEAKDEQSPTILAAAGESGNNKPCVAYTLKIRSGCEGGGKGALIQNDKSATLATNNDQYLFQPMAYSFDSLASNSMKSSNPHSGCRAVEVEKTLDTTDPNPCKNQGGIAVLQPICMATQQGGAEIRTDDKAPTITAAAGMSGNNQPVVCYDIGEARLRIPSEYEEQSPTLTARCETGGNNVPAVVMKEQHLFENHSQDSRYRGPLDVCPMLPAQLGTGGNNTPLVAEATPAHDQPVYCLQGNGIDRADGVKEDICYTLNTIDRPAVCYAEPYQKVTGPLMANSHPGSYSGQDAYQDMLVVGKEKIPVAIDRAAFNQGQNAQYAPQFYTDGTNPTLIARGPSAVAYKEKIRYIVRRLTPTECARLQGFPDTWGHINPKEDFTDEEYQFWCDVYLTKALIDGTVVRNEDGELYFKSRMKPYKHKTKEQMLTWYNKLHTDSAEYKMWGNGIALPTALYVMQGIADAIKEGHEKEPSPQDNTHETKETEDMEYNDRVEGERNHTMEKLDTIQQCENLNEVYRYGQLGPGGAYHDYEIVDPNDPEVALACIEFQRGPRKDPNARHGVLDSDLLEIVRDRLIAFCSGEMSNPETERALSHVEAALHYLNKRVEDRIARQVLGTMEK